MPRPTVSHFRHAARRLTTWTGSLLLVLVVSVASIALVLALWPTDHTSVAGLPLEVGAELNLVSPIHGSAILISHGERRSIQALGVWGPLRPVIVTNADADDLIASAQRLPSGQQVAAELTQAYRHWAVRRSLALAGTALVLLACLVALVAHWVPWRRRLRLGLLLVGVLPLTWTGLLWGGFQAADQLQHVSSPADLFAYQTLRTAPAPVGPKQSGYDVVVLGDSRVSRYGGALANRPTPTDQACGRSRDSLAAQLGILEQYRGLRALNLACSGATIDAGLMGPQTTGSLTVVPQIGALEQVESPRAVVLAIGPNDVYWSDVLTACYATSCNVTALEPTVNTSLAHFQAAYHDVLDELAALPSHPQIIIMGSYDLFSPNPTCADVTAGPGQTIDPGEAAFLSASNSRLNRVLEDGATGRHFAYVEPHLTPLCGADTTGLGSDLYGLSSPYRFHPTAVGELKLAAQAAATLQLKD